MGRKSGKSKFRKRENSNTGKGNEELEVLRIFSQEWWNFKSPALFYAGKFLLLSGFLYVLFLLPLQSHLNDSFSEVIAWIGHTLICLLGEECHRSSSTLYSCSFSVMVASECSGAGFLSVVISAIFLFPSSRLLRVLGVVMGCLLFTVINILRVVSLYLTGVRSPSFFPLLHEQIWPALLPPFTILIVIGWMAWVFSKKPRETF